MSDFKGTSFGDLVKHVKEQSLKYDLKEELAELEKINGSNEARWKEAHKRRLEIGFKPSFKIGDPFWNAQMFKGKTD